MNKAFMLVFFMLLLVAGQASALTEDQILSKVFDPLTNKLKVDAEVTFGSIEVTIETPTGMESNTLTVIVGATNEVLFSPNVKSVLIQNSGDYPVKFIVNRSSETSLSTIQSGGGIAFDMVLSSMYFTGVTGTSTVQIDAWR